MEFTTSISASVLYRLLNEKILIKSPKKHKKIKITSYTRKTIRRFYASSRCNPFPWLSNNVNYDLHGFFYDATVKITDLSYGKWLSAWLFRSSYPYTLKPKKELINLGYTSRCMLPFEFAIRVLQNHKDANEFIKEYNHIFNKQFR